jgi:squalene-hopene/tetraprenyl-beta-curcumene cyclase
MRCLFALPLVTAFAFFSPALSLAADAPAKPTDSTKVVDAGVAFLRKAQEENGTWSPKTGTGVTSIVTAALLRSGVAPSDPTVAKSLKYIEAQVREDGGIYVAESTNKNYETCLAILCLKEANKDGKYTKLIAGADKFAKSLQWGSNGMTDKSNVNFGGAGYGSKNRPDMSNTSFLIEALVAAGNGPDDENVQRALVFISRCQNLESEHNTTPFAAKINDGGFYYTVANGGETNTLEKDPNGGLRSYASMTYAGLKSFIHAGLKADDPRVKAAKTWIAKHYDLSTNPGAGNQGLFYYYVTFAKTLNALGDKNFTDDKGVTHDWKAELIATLASRQKPDGSWLNEEKRWMETDPNLVTAYALLALSYAK